MRNAGRGLTSRDSPWRQPAPSVFDISVAELTDSNGTINLDLMIGNDIETLAGVPLGDSPTVTNDETYTIDNLLPRLSSLLRQDPSNMVTNADVLVRLKPTAYGRATLIGSAGPA